LVTELKTTHRHHRAVQKRFTKKLPVYPQVALILIARTQKGMARLSWSVQPVPCHIRCGTIITFPLSRVTWHRLAWRFSSQRSALFRDIINEHLGSCCCTSSVEHVD